LNADREQYFRYSLVPDLIMANGYLNALLFCQPFWKKPSSMLLVVKGSTFDKGDILHHFTHSFALYALCHTYFTHVMLSCS